MKYIILLFLVILFSMPLANAQRAYPDTVSGRKLAAVIAAESVFYVAGMSYLQFVWYKDSKRVPLHFYDDTRGWNQLDKAGHAFSAYYESYIGYHALRWAGVSKTKALIFGAPLGLFLQTPIEIFDGIYDSWGFSRSDMIANTAGPVLFTIQQAIWDEQIIRMKISYSPSPYAPHRPAYFGKTQTERFFHDYNGHTYWLSANINRIVPALHSPKWLNLAVGYSANGMLGEFCQS